MRRVVITGMGIVSPLGDTTTEVLASLRESRSGIRFHAPYREIGLRSQVGGFTQVDIKEQIDKKNLRFMGNAAAYAYILESLKHYPAQNGVAALMRKLGMANVRIVNLLGGVMSINYGEMLKE